MKQLFTVLSFIVLAGIVVISFVVFVVNDFQLKIEIILPFAIALILLSAIITYIVRDEINNRKDLNSRISGNRNTIIEYHYTKDDWNHFARLLLKKEMFHYYKIFFLILACVIAFLMVLYVSDMTVFFVFFFISSLIFTPIFIASVLRFYKRKRIYFDDENPSVKITHSGVLINSEVTHPFNYLGKLYEVKIDSLHSVPCIKFTTFYKNHSGGGAFKTSFVPIPMSELKGVNETVEKLRKLLM